MAKKNPHVKPVSQLKSAPGFTARHQKILQEAAAKNGARPNRADSKFTPGTKADVAFAQKRVAGQPTWKAPSSSFTPNQAGSKFKPGSRADHAFTGVKSNKPASFSPTTTASDIRPKASARAPKVRKMGTGPIGVAVTGAANAAMGIYDKARAKKAK